MITFYELSDINLAARESSSRKDHQAGAADAALKRNIGFSPVGKVRQRCDRRDLDEHRLGKFSR